MKDSILFWNDVAIEANRRDFSMQNPQQGGPTLSSRALAIIHLAMYDAYFGVTGTKSSYLPNLPVVPSGDCSEQDAVAAAAHTVLSSLYSAQKDFFDEKLSESCVKDQCSIAFGKKVGELMLATRQNDPGAGAGDYRAKMGCCKHRVDPDNSNQSFHAPFYGANSKLFVATERHTIDPPPSCCNDNKEYVRALQEVRSKGIAPELMGTLPDGSDKRTPDETTIGVYWAYDGVNEIGTPPRLYNQIARKIAITRNQTEADNAQMFAMVNAAMGDAGILAWEVKYRDEFWRPVVGIREHDESICSMNEANGSDNLDDDCDPFWLPLGAPKSNDTGKNFTPPFPAYPSGHATFGAAALHILRLWLGTAAGNTQADNHLDGLVFVSDEMNGVTTDNKGTVRPKHLRKFTDGLWQMIIENGWSRIYLGVHWSFDAFALNAKNEPDLSKNVGGVPLGLAIAEDVFTNSRIKK